VALGFVKAVVDSILHQCGTIDHHSGFRESVEERSLNLRGCLFSDFYHFLLIFERFKN
jgi:hypothetical protein